MITRPLLHRRTVLRGLGGLGGACIALPLLEAMGAWDSPSPGAPRRFVVFWTPNGTILDHWLPTGSEDDFTLSRILKPLEEHHSDLLVVSGVDELSAYQGPGDAHQKGTGQGLTCTELQEGDFPGADGLSAGWGDGISVDQAIADAIAEDTRFRSLEFGVHVYGANVGSRISYRGPAQPIPPENDPKAAFDRIFGDLDVDPAEQMRRLAERELVLGAVSEDYDRLVKRASADDRQKLQAHLDAVRDLQMRLGSGVGVGGACQVPELGVVSDPDSVANIPANGLLQMDLLAMALACDLTRVASIMWMNSATNKPYPWLDITEGHHELAHRGDEDLDAREKLTQINVWYAEQFAYLIGKLKSIPEGEGTLLDNTVLIWVNEHQKGNVHDRHSIPYVIAGGGGGSIKTGRWLDVPGDVPHNNLMVGLMHAMGLEEVTSFGNPAYSTGSIELG
ncbi:MAG: DUF1552 domain-containing protein [Nannocystaceae bacterium]